MCTVIWWCDLVWFGISFYKKYFCSWGYGSIMVLDALTGKTLHREHRYDNSSYNADVVYDAELDMFFSSTYKHAVGFKVTD